MMTKTLKQWLVDHNLAQPSWTDQKLFENAAAKAVQDEILTPKKLGELLGEDGKPDPNDVFSGIKLHEPSRRYSSEKSVGKHKTTGKPVQDEHGREVQLPSQREYAKAGALLKFRAARDGVSVSLSEHERELVAECFEKDTWCGPINNQWQDDIPGSRVKALIDESGVGSNGGDLNPIWFDDLVVQFPLLHSELLPLVDLRPVPRGSSIEGSSVGNVTAQWGVASGTSLGLFDTTSLVAGIDSTIYPVSVALEVSRDLLADSPADVGRVLVENIGQRMLAELDKVICVGNGTSQPLGVFNAAGLTDIGNPAGGAGSAPQITDYEALLFGVPKQYRARSNRCAFIASDTSYQRARSIPVGTADARRVFGMTHEDYQLLGRPFKISADVANNQAAFGDFSKYRLYRRQGSEVRWVTEGKELALKNLNLLVVRGRYAGRVIDANSFAYSDNWQA